MPQLPTKTIDGDAGDDTEDNSGLDEISFDDWAQMMVSSGQTARGLAELIWQKPQVNK